MHAGATINKGEKGTLRKSPIQAGAAKCSLVTTAYVGHGHASDGHGHRHASIPTKGPCELVVTPSIRWFDHGISDFVCLNSETHPRAAQPTQAALLDAASLATRLQLGHNPTPGPMSCLRFLKSVL